MFLMSLSLSSYCVNRDLAGQNDGTGQNDGKTRYEMDMMSVLFLPFIWVTQYRGVCMKER